MTTNEKTYYGFRIWLLLLVGASIGLVATLFSSKFLIGYTSGAALMTANVLAMQWATPRVFAKSPGKALFPIILLSVKFAVLLGLSLLFLAWFKVDAVAFASGLTVSLAATTLLAVRNFGRGFALS